MGDAVTEGYDGASSAYNGDAMLPMTRFHNFPGTLRLRYASYNEYSRNDPIQPIMHAHAFFINRFLPTFTHQCGRHELQPKTLVNASVTARSSIDFRPLRLQDNYPQRPPSMCYAPNTWTKLNHEAAKTNDFYDTPLSAHAIDTQHQPALLSLFTQMLYEPRSASEPRRRG